LLEITRLHVMKVIPFLQLQPDGYVLFRDYATGDLAQVDLLLHFTFLTHRKLKSAQLLSNLFSSDNYL